MKVEQRVKIWIATNDSGYASECFGVEAQNDWFDIQYYPEQIEAIIIRNKGVILAQHVFMGKSGELRGKVYDISKNGISKRIQDIKEMLEYYRMSINNFLEDVNMKSLNEFYNIEC